MDPSKIVEATRTANEAVKELPDDLKKDAFNTILNKLLDAQFTTNVVNTGQKKDLKSIRKGNRKSKTASRVVKVSEDDAVTKELLAKISRSQHQIVYKFEITLDKALYILKIARDELNQDEITATQIHLVLSRVFNIKITYNAISMALMKAYKYVDKVGNPIKYRIMHDGEVYLQGKIEAKENDKEKQ